jgi:aspartyl-tRNA(Asn)/glutamyl-tRNA(Gln) amidotransferase subunit C
MRISREEVAHIAELAKLGLTEEEMELFSQQLSEMLEYAEMLNQLDTEAIPPTAQVIRLQNVARPDSVAPSLAQEEVLANAPNREDGYFRVRLVLE